MRKTATTTVTTETDVTVDVICNKCGQSCCLPSASGSGEPEQYGLIEPSVSGCYSSPVLPDLCTYRFSLCEACLADMFDTFKIPPESMCRIDGDAADGWRR